MFLDIEQIYTTLSVILHEICSALQHISKMKEGKDYANKTHRFSTTFKKLVTLYLFAMVNKKKIQSL